MYRQWSWQMKSSYIIPLFHMEQNTLLKYIWRVYNMLGFCDSNVIILSNIIPWKYSNWSKQILPRYLCKYTRCQPTPYTCPYLLHSGTIENLENWSDLMIISRTNTIKDSIVSRKFSIFRTSNRQNYYLMIAWWTKQCVLCLYF